MSNIPLIDLSYEDYLYSGHTTEYYDSECFVEQYNTEDNILINHLIKNNTIEIIKILKNKKEPEKILHAKNEDGETPMHIALFMSNYEITKLFLEYGGDPNIKDKNDQTLFHVISFMTDDKFVVLMLKHKGNINSQDKYGNTPLHLAVVIKNYEMVKLLLDHNCDRTIINNINLTAKEYALHDKEMLKLFR